MHTHPRALELKFIISNSSTRTRTPNWRSGDARFAQSTGGSNNRRAQQSLNGGPTNVNNHGDVTLTRQGVFVHSVTWARSLPNFLRRLCRGLRVSECALDDRLRGRAAFAEIEMGNGQLSFAS